MVFSKRAFAALLLETFMNKEMFNIDPLLESLNSTEGMNKIVVGIIIVAAINAIFITYSVRSTYGIAKKERKKQQIQQAKIDKLSPK